MSAVTASVPENGGPPALGRPPRWLLGLWLAGMILLWKPWIHGTDPAGYYAWVRTVVCDGDLDTTDEFERFGRKTAQRVSPGPTGLNRSPYAIGTALFWSPFFAIAHGLGRASGLASDGYGRLAIAAVCFATALYALAGLWLCLLAARRLTSERAAAFATAAVWWATPLVFYMYGQPGMSHGIDTFVNALFVFTWLRGRRHRTSAGWIALGAAHGLAMLVRPQNALLAILPAADAVLALGRDRGPRQRGPDSIDDRRPPGAGRRKDVAGLAGGAALYAVAAVAAFAPQLAVWKATYGVWLPGNPYNIPGYHGRFGGVPVHFFQVLFSSRAGLFVWSPITALAVFGLATAARRRDPVVGLGLLAVLAAQVAVIGSWSSWSGGWPVFGQRMLIDATPAYVIGIAALIDRHAATLTRRRLIASAAALATWNLLLMAQHITGMYPRASDVSHGRLLVNQVLVVPRVLGRMGDLVRLRGERWR